MQLDTVRDTAHELRVPHWIDGEGKQTRALMLSDLGDGYKIIYCFQHWCPGCHSTGFPTLVTLHAALKPTEVGLVAVQTVFEGEEVNTLDKLRVNQRTYDLSIPFGHDIPVDGERRPSFMEDYRTGGTPWFTVIDPEGSVVFSDFRLDAGKFLKVLDEPVPSG